MQGKLEKKIQEAPDPDFLLFAHQRESLKAIESNRLKNRCPECGKLLTVGVLSRVETLADRSEGFKLESGIPGRHLVPLDEIIPGEVTIRSKTRFTKKVVPQGV